MALFRRTPRGSTSGAADAAKGEQAQAISAFWAWWQAAGRDLATGLVEGRLSTDEVVGPMTERVHAIDSGLEWELNRDGGDSQHRLTVTPAGVPELRAVARRWRRAAPPADATWSYSDQREASASTGSDLAGEGINLDGRDYRVGEVNVEARVRGAAVDVSLQHPHFIDVDEPARLTAAYLLLDLVLGEAAVETWVGEVTTSPLAGLDPIPLAALRSVVRDLREQHTDADGTPHYLMLSGEAPDGRPVLALAQIPLKPVTAPHLDTYVGLFVPYREQTEQGLPDTGSLDRLRALEAHLGERLGESGRIVATQSHGGLRILHAYVDGATPAAEQLRVAALGWGEGPVRVETHHDPAWSEVRHLRG